MPAGEVPANSASQLGQLARADPALRVFKDLLRFLVLQGMARELRFIPGGMLVETTTRTIEGRFFVRPSRELNDLVVGVLARAKARYPVEVCALLRRDWHLLGHLLGRKS